jgi:hypothetical protein
MEKAADRFAVRKQEFDALLDRLKAYSENNFGVKPDDINWNHVGSIGFGIDRLTDVAEFYGVAP